MSDLHAAAYDGSVEALLEHMKQALDLNERDLDCQGRTPLHWAASNDHEECANILLKHGADPNITMFSGFTTLHCAAQSGSIAIVKMLISNGVSVDRRDKSGDSALRIAERYGNIECGRIIYQALEKAGLSSRSTSPSHQASETNGSDRSSPVGSASGESASQPTDPSSGKTGKSVIMDKLSHAATPSKKRADRSGAMSCKTTPCNPEPGTAPALSVRAGTSGASPHSPKSATGPSKPVAVSSRLPTSQTPSKPAAARASKATTSPKKTPLNNKSPPKLVVTSPRQQKPSVPRSSGPATATKAANSATAQIRSPRSDVSVRDNAARSDRAPGDATSPDEDETDSDFKERHPHLAYDSDDDIKPYPIPKLIDVIGHPVSGGKPQPS